MRFYCDDAKAPSAATMEVIHYQQQQLAKVLSAALPKDDSFSISPTDEEDESSRIAAINSLHDTILCSSNSFLVTHSAQFLAQGFSQLLSDKYYTVRKSGAKAFGALCSVVSSVSLASNGSPNQVILGKLIDQFFNWALPLVSYISAGDNMTTELALDGLNEFLNVGDPEAIESYASSILKASQELLEDERTSCNLLHQVLDILTLLSQKFSRCFQSHFLDIVDLLIGWALVPYIAESDRRLIVDSFMHFKLHWVGNMSFSLRLMLKFLDDIDVLLQDRSPGTIQQFQRLLALLSCFLTVLQSVASGLSEMRALDQISDPLTQMVPRLLRYLSMIGNKFGWSKCLGDSWRCFILLAESLREGFCSFYSLTVDILFQSLEMDDTFQPVPFGKINSFQVHGVLKTNLQLLSLQRLDLLPSSVQKILQFDMPISHLRLHPNHLVTASSSATYIFLLQHANTEVVEQAVKSLFEEIKILMDMLEKNDCISYSKSELFALIKFDLVALLSCVFPSEYNTLISQPDIAALYLKRSGKLIALIVDKLNPFELPILGCVELQVTLVKTLGQLSAVEFLSKRSLKKHPNQEPCVNIASKELLGKKKLWHENSYMVIEHLDKFNIFLIRSLGMTSPVPLKVEALKWIQNFCQDVISLYETSDEIINQCSCNSFGHISVVGNLIYSVLDVSYDRDPKLRAHVATGLELLLKARLVHPNLFYPITELALDKLGDPEMEIKNAFGRLLSIFLPITMHQYGLRDSGALTAGKNGFTFSSNRSYLYWKQVFALKQLPQQLQLQQLVSILNYISQRLKTPLSSWILRFIQRCRSLKDFVLNEVVEAENCIANGSWLTVKTEDDILYKISSVNNLAGVWWAIHEATRYCIFTRLRTNLGGPTQTFAALERMLLDVSHWMQLETDLRGDNLNITGSSNACLLPMRLLLDFVESLKKNTFNAYDGSTVLPPTNQQSSLFFRVNKKVCEEWFSRICEPMMNAGLALQCHDVVIHYCALRLQELKVLMASALRDKSRTKGSESFHNISVKFSEDISSVSKNMALAFCKSHDPESLIGLQEWISTSVSSFFVDEENKSLCHNWMLVTFSWITGLIYQARGQYEKAAAHFTHLLQSDELPSSMGSDCVHFIIARIIECYTAVSDWKSLESWLLELQTLRARHAGKRYSGALTAAGFEVNAIQAWAHFDKYEFQEAWACLDLTPKTCNELTLDPKLALQRSELMLLRAMLFQSEGKVEKIPHEIQKAKSMLEEILSVLPLGGLTEAAAYATQLHCIYAFEDGYKFRFSGDEQKQQHLILNSYIQVLPSIVNTIHQDCGLWLKIHRVYHNIVHNSLACIQLSMNIFTLARKQGNLGLANRLNDYLKDHVLSLSEGSRSVRSFIMSSLQYEGILLMHAEHKIEVAIANLCTYVHPCVVSLTSIVPDSDDSLLKSKACLKLSKWLKQKHLSAMNLENVVLKMLLDFKLSDDSSGSKGGISVNDENAPANHNVQIIINEIIGTLTKLSTRLCPTMGKSWISYASWCYSIARDSLSSSHENILCSSPLSSILVPEILPDRYKLTEDEALKVESVILQLFQKHKEAVHLNIDREGHSFRMDYSENLNNEGALKATVDQVVDIIEASAGGENYIGDSLSTTLNSQLQKFFYATVELNGKELSSSLDDLMAVWWSLRKRRMSLFGHAAHGFIQYLSYSSSHVSDGKFVLDCKPLNQHKSGSYTLRATLYVLHILLNYGAELKETIEPGLSTIPLLSWQEIIPQLFGRLTSHPEQGIRKQLEGILMMLAKLFPNSIVYPTLVDVNACDAEPFEELQHIMGCLSKLYPRLIQDVQLMINELENLSVLWEELWLSTLQDLHTDVIRRINVLKDEAARIAENVSLSRIEKARINAAKYSAMMAPIVVALERRLASTSRKPETNHEIWFNKEFLEHLKSAILSFKVPPVSIAELGDVWRPFDNIAASIICYQKKSSISFEEVAPKLSFMSSSDVPIPGLEKQFSISGSDRDLQYNSLGKTVKIASFSDQVCILSTKTRPKKLVILGSDGEKYTFLLKGREDLRLDARIMQLLQAVNGCIRSSPRTRSQFLGIRYYSVTPISGRAGLIQWVDNVLSVYSIFKSWQIRAQIAQLSVSGAGNLKTTNCPPVPRPNDMFYGKIIPALKEKGIWRVISRRDWPHEVKKKVLLELMTDAPKQLLHQELWCASEGFEAFSSKVKRYSGSVAAMSIVGHILGLGDRHLDNILLDFSTGDIVHIDYNVCFDKGKKLRIPEVVPFRLTQTIEAALGFTGIEGTFRANCEKIVHLLRKNKDIILMILEVFLWDPLVEWTRGDLHVDATIGGEERKGMELAVSLSLFASRVQEIRVPLQEHHDLLLATLPAVASALQNFAEVLNRYERVSTIFFHVDEERSNLILHESSAKSIASEATSNLENVHASFEFQAQEFAQTKAMVAEIAHEATTWLEQHGNILDALRNNSISVFKPVTKLSTMVDSLSLTSAVSMAGVPLTVVPEPTLMQCHDIDREVSQLINDLDQGISYAVGALEEYSIYLQRILPMNYSSSTPVNGWAQVLQLSINTISPDILAIVKRKAAELIANSCDNDHDSIMCRHNDLCLKAERYAMKRDKIELECAELINSIDLDTESNAKKRVVSDLVKYMQFAGFLEKGGGASSMHLQLSKFDRPKHANLLAGMDDNREKAYSSFNLAIASMYLEIKNKSFDILSNSSKQKRAQCSLKSDFGTFFSNFQEQVEKCILIDDVFNEICQIFCRDSTNGGDLVHMQYPSEIIWLSNIKKSLLSCKSLAGQLNETVLPDIVRSTVSYKSEVMDAFKCLSQIRGSIDATLEQLIDVELERASLLELERNYVTKVSLFTEQRLALEEASAKGRDHLSWEEAEELASQEEACKAQLDQLHGSWNQKDHRSHSLINTEASIKNSFLCAERHFESFANLEQESETSVCKGKVFLSTLIKLFSDLESIDKALSSVCYFTSPHAFGISNLRDLNTSGYPVSEFIFKFSSVLNNHCFFIWKVGVLNLFIDSCIQDVASFDDQKVGFDHLLNVVKKKIEIILQQQIDLYLKERIGPAFLAWLEKRIEHLKHLAETTKRITPEQENNDNVEVKQVKELLKEYCNAHETGRAARSVASAMKNQMNELGEALFKTSLEIVQMEWIHGAILNPSLNNRILFHKFLSCDDNLYPIILNFSRHTILEIIRSGVSKIARPVESLKACKIKTGIAEGQLERAMAWVCGCSNFSATGNQANKNSGIPPEFHEHLLKRREMLCDIQENASEIIKISKSLLEFEASRDGVFGMPAENYQVKNSGDGRAWQQACFNALTRLDVTYHSFTRIEQEWKLAQSSMEAASSVFFSATNELSLVSMKVKSASDDLQSTLIVMRDCAYELRLALSAFSQGTKVHTALTSECGSMLEEVLAITEGLHDIHNLVKEAATAHHIFLEDLLKASSVLVPLESVLSKDIDAMTSVMTMERESKMEITPKHGQAIHQSYSLRITEALQVFRPLVSSLTFSVERLPSMLTKIAHTASFHAGNLHKALEGICESQEDRSHGLGFLSSYRAGDDIYFDTKEEVPRSNARYLEDMPTFSVPHSHDKGWLSPPDTIYSSSDSSITSTVSCLPDDFPDRNDAIEHISLETEVTVRPSMVSCSSKSFAGTGSEEFFYCEGLESKLPEDNNSDPGYFISSINEPSGSLISGNNFLAVGVENTHCLEKEIMGIKLGLKNEASSTSNVVGIRDRNEETCVPTMDTGKQIRRGKNAYAMSVLRQVELKLDGCDIDKREFSIAEQVDYLLKQAMSIDNLCNMYEGWTPWI